MSKDHWLCINNLVLITTFFFLLALVCSASYLRFCIFEIPCLFSVRCLVFIGTYTVILGTGTKHVVIVVLRNSKYTYIWQNYRLLGGNRLLILIVQSYGIAIFDALWPAYSAKKYLYRFWYWTGNYWTSSLEIINLTSGAGGSTRPTGPGEFEL